jgi:hypothetical protein
LAIVEMGVGKKIIGQKTNGLMKTKIMLIFV